MTDKLLVDTSAWIASFRDTGALKLKEYLKTALDLDKAVTTNVVVLELLQGCKSNKEFDALKSRLDVLPLYPLTETTWETAYKAGFSLRRKGITVPTIDILLCSIASEHGLILLHHDSHLKTVSREMAVKAVDFLKA